MEKKLSTRVIIRTKDVMRLLDCTENHAKKILQKVRKAFNKPPGTYVTIQEFSIISGISIEEIKNTLGIE